MRIEEVYAMFKAMPLEQDSTQKLFHLREDYFRVCDTTRRGLYEIKLYDAVSVHHWVSKDAERQATCEIFHECFGLIASNWQLRAFCGLSLDYEITDNDLLSKYKIKLLNGEE